MNDKLVKNSYNAGHRDIGTGDIHFEQLIPMITNIPNEYAECCNILEAVDNKTMLKEAKKDEI